MKPSMKLISSLKPDLTWDDAVARLCPGGPTGVFKSLWMGPLRSVADVYVPFRLYRVEMLNGKQRRSQFFALDAVRGSLDLYGFERAPQPSELVRFETRNYLEPALGEGRSQEILAEKLRRMVFLDGFCRVRNFSIQTERVPLDLHIPYWVGFHGRGECARVSVLDAVRGRIEGARARELLQNWLQH